ncbi:uncharacterized protein BDW43DRAFT_213339 [Aspergillus alliaceus]|uniref:uncharacterized protein n=1 Tax=Petromyces alliaceus TaxID=209559 RepID=UPI0012A6965C|nr:uncharacterized protein BDW43DRAFT_213339 [Aspergillus alliaceus]KAB8228549.1 hypothetical protein BDW43DRAFT_213339 [Aspergillus alliaceus]
MRELLCCFVIPSKTHAMLRRSIKSPDLFSFRRGFFFSFFVAAPVPNADRSRMGLGKGNGGNTADGSPPKPRKLIFGAKSCHCLFHA